jgi:hypothetical protein
MRFAVTANVLVVFLSMRQVVLLLFPHLLEEPDAEEELDAEGLDEAVVQVLLLPLLLLLSQLSLLLLWLILVSLLAFLSSAI